ncbi:putative h3 k56 histone acetylation protein kat11 protein [Eutypa lata UCREL1]|uniref:histone acetyltransferase n=1 Tax=Eutypa lata (strain UCR-EL1) TaxID=1287681 RepID=M7T5L2_EUTLA|nr:putative h3 k56 histone acetylation protein kat11 protein [Eutypa lata UCREL1]
MASPSRREHVSGANSLLVEELSKVLPKDVNFEAYHLSTPPTVTDALFHPPAQALTLETEEPRPTKPLRTYCEKHFLALSVDAGKYKPSSQGQVLVLGLEIYIYTTSYSTTIFVSKADSTGYLNLLNLPKGTPSPIREVTVAFIAFLVTTRQRSSKKLVARFVEELEEGTSTKVKLSKGWRSPRSLHEFWEMMAFRQECSSGRLTGFIWVVFDAKLPPRRPNAAVLPTPSASFSGPDASTLVTPADSQETPTAPASSKENTSKSTATAPEANRRKKPAKKVLKGRIIPRKPQIKTHNRTKFPDRIETHYYYWPEEGRGQVVLDESGYNRAIELLLHLEFSKLDVATTSTARWINEVNVGAKWGLQIVGLRDAPVRPSQSSVSTSSGVNNLSGMIRRKRPAEGDAATNDGNGSAAAAPPVAVNTLGAGLVRKKAKIADADEDASVPGQEAVGLKSKVNVLSAGLVRRKAKPMETEAEKEV